MRKNDNSKDDIENIIKTARQWYLAYLVRRTNNSNISDITQSHLISVTCDIYLKDLAKEGKALKLFTEFRKMMRSDDDKTIFFNHIFLGYIRSGALSKEYSKKYPDDPVILSRSEAE